MSDAAESSDARQTLTSSRLPSFSLTPGHAAAAASLGSIPTPSPSRISRPTLSPARPSTLSSGTKSFTKHDDLEGGGASLLGATQSNYDNGGDDNKKDEDDNEGHSSKSAIHSSSSQSSSTMLQQRKVPPSISVDLAELPPARPLTAAQSDKEQQSRPSSATNPAPDFLTQRLRSAIGQDLLFEEEQGDQIITDENIALAAAQDDQQLASPSIRSRTSSRTDSPKEIAQSIGKKVSIAQGSDHQSTQVKAASSSSSDSIKTGWGWSTLATLPTTLRIDNALQSLSLQGKDKETAESNETLQGQSQNKSGETSKVGEKSGMADYVAALDVRKWFALGGESTSNGEGETKKNVESGKDTASVIRPSMTVPGMPSGSYPSSSIIARKRKERERLLEVEKRKEKAKEAASQSRGKVVAPDATVEIALDQDLLGRQSAQGDAERFARHEYLVMSTAGKPVYWSRVSKARLNRAKINRERRRRQQEVLDARRAEGQDVSQDNANVELREETFAKEEQVEQNEEDQLEATRVGLLQAIISSFAETDKTKLHATAKEVLELPEQGKVCFLLRPPLYLVAVARWDDAESTLRNHLDYLYQAIISLVSATKLNRLFDRAANFDLKRLLQGTDNILDSLLTRLQDETIAMRGALQPLRLDAAIRHDAGAALLPSRSKQARPQDALYALLLTRKGLITLARRRKVGINPMDCHSIINTVLSTKALKEGGSQAWVPICLPKFAPQGFVYAHVSFLQDHSKDTAAGVEQRRTYRPELGLVLITGNPDGFDDMSAWRERIVGHLQETKLLRLVLHIARGIDEDDHEAIKAEAPQHKDSSNSNTAVRAASTYSADDLGLAGLRHFCFKWRSNVQSTSPLYEEPYAPGTENQRRLLHLYDLAYDYVVRHGKETQSDENAIDRAGGFSGGKGGAQSNEADDASSQRSLTERQQQRQPDNAKPPAVRPSRSVSPPIVARSVLTGKAPAKQDPASISSSSGGKVNENGIGNTGVSSIFGDVLRGSGILGSSAGGGDVEDGARQKPTTSSSSLSSMRILRTQSESILAWSTHAFEVYVAASPHASRAALVAMAKGVIRWIKQEEHKLFIVSAPVF